MGLEVAAITATISAFLTTTVVGSVTVGQILLTVALTGAQYAMAALQRPKRPPGVDQSIKQTVRVSDPPQRRVYGEVQTGGAIFFYETRGSYLYVGFALSTGIIEGVTEFRINGKKFRIDAAGNALDAPFLRSNGTIYVKVSVRNGTDDQAIDPILAADFPELPASFRQRGVATVVVRAHYGTSRDMHDEIYGSGGGFECLFTVKGARVYDPSDPMQSRDDPATWRWSDAATLCIADYTRHERFGRVSPDRIEWESVAESAVRDREPVGLKGGGFQQRYTINGVVDTSQTPRDIITAMLTANRGRAVPGPDAIRFLSGKGREPEFTISDDMVTGAVELRTTAARAQLINRIKTEFISPDREWQSGNGPVLDFDDWQAADGAIFEHTIQLPFTGTHQRAQRLAKAYALDARYGRYLNMTCSLAALPAIAGAVCRVSLTWLPAADGLYQIEAAEFDERLRQITLRLSEHDAVIEDDWTPETDEMPFEIAPAEIA